MRLLAQCNRVLWLESLAMRVPRLGSGRDLRRMARRLARRLGARRVEADLWVASPLVLPLPHSRWAATVNRWVLRWPSGDYAGGSGWSASRCGPSYPPPAITPAPSAAGRSCTTASTTGRTRRLRRRGVAAAEARLCQAADVVFATSQSLVAEKRQRNRHTHHAPHGVDHAHFARALDPDLPVAAEVACLPRPVLAVVGLLDWRIDTELLAELVIAGPTGVSCWRAPCSPTWARSRHAQRSLARPPPLRPSSGGAEGVCGRPGPFVVGEYTRHIDPVKLREYLSAGLPVVATALPEVAAIDVSCRIVRGVDELVVAVEAALRDGGPEARSRRSRAMASETWETRVEALGAHLERLCAVEAADPSAPEAPAA